MIYELLLVSRNDENNITPDLNGTRKKYGLLNRIPQFHGKLALLRTCQHVYAEASGILYGQNIFYFSGKQHGKARLRQPGFTESIPWSDITTMYDFFCKIRKQRFKLRHIHLHFTSKTYASYSEESGKAKGANLVGEASELLGRGHCIASMELTFSRRTYGSNPMALLGPRSSRLYNKLELIRGIQELRSRTVDGLVFNPALYSQYSPELRRMFCGSVKSSHEEARIGLKTLKALIQDKEPSSGRSARSLDSISKILWKLSGYGFKNLSCAKIEGRSQVSKFWNIKTTV